MGFDPWYVSFDACPISDLLLLEMDGAGVRMDQSGGEEVWGRELAGHFQPVPLQRTDASDDQGSLADHEEAWPSVTVEWEHPALARDQL